MSSTGVKDQQDKIRHRSCSEVCHCILYTIDCCIIKIWFNITKIGLFIIAQYLLKLVYTCVHVIYCFIFFLCKVVLVEILGLVASEILRF